MKVSLRWIKDFVPVAAPPPELARRLTLAGLEIKDIELTGDWENIVIGQITAINPHPNADRLKLATVNTGAESITVVTGAPNIREEIKVAFARLGAELIDGHTGERTRLKPAKIRGIVSTGMVCSEKELGISDSHEGIMILPADAPVGAPLADYLGDAVFNLEVTPNRADCLSVIGIAREIAALTANRVTVPDISYPETGGPIEREVSVTILEPELCPRYCASLITGVRVAPSPDWMQQRLIACGMRPINNIVDITNYVMLEQGQPLHAFDFARIRGNKIIVRRASPGERMMSLDGVERSLAPDMLVIADADHPVAIAGVMGGAESEVAETTTSILLEAANFKPASIYHTGHTLGLPSEARMRFERGIRPELTQPALRRATQLIVELGGGKAAQGVIDVYPGRKEMERIRLSVAESRRVLGADYSIDKIADTLSLVGFELSKEGEALLVTPPYWRNDIHLEVDLIEEVARIAGYDTIPMTMLSDPIPRHDPDPSFKLSKELGQALAGYGFAELVTYSLIGMDMLAKLSPEGMVSPPLPLRVANPMTAEQEYLRPTLRAGLLAAFAANRRYEDGGIRLFELDKVYLPREAGLPQEPYMLCAVLGGARTDKSWYGGGEPVDFYDAKGIVEATLSRLGAGVDFAEGHDSSLHPTRQAAILVEGKRVGVMGEVHLGVRLGFEIAEPVYLFEIDAGALLPFAAPGRAFEPIPRFPPVTRDIALVVDKSVPHRRIVETIKAFPLVKKADIFDLYIGAQVPAGKKSVAYRIVFQSPEHTLTDEEVNKVLNEILARLAHDFGAVIRG